MTQPSDGSIQLDVTHMYPYKIFTWKIEKAQIAPHLGISFHQKWPYAPYHQMIASLQNAAHDAALFLCLAALTLLILGDELRLERLALLAGLFALPYWVLMSGGVPLPESVLPAQFAEAQVKALPVLAVLPLVLTLFVLRGHSRTGTALVLLLMAVLMLGHPLLETVPEEPKRRAIESAAQIGPVGYAAGLSLFAVVRKFFRRWLGRVRAQKEQKIQTKPGDGDVQNGL